MNDFLTKAKELLEVQGRDGNWNYDEYMRGLYNGMEMIIALAEGREPVYKIVANEHGKCGSGSCDCLA